MNARRFASRFARPSRAGVIAVLVALGLGLASCSRVPDELRWREQVTLSDGRTIVIQRHVTFRQRSAIGGPREVFTTSSTTDAVDPPGLFPTFSEDIIVQVLDVSPETGNLAIAGNFDTCKAWNLAGRPPLLTLYLELVDGKWQRRELPKSWTKRDANLLVKVFYVTELPPNPLITPADLATVQTAPPMGLEQIRLLASPGEGCARSAM